jgi:hypothetical protein
MKVGRQLLLNALLVFPTITAYVAISLVVMAGAPAYLSLKYFRKRRYVAAFAAVFVWYVVPFVSLGVICWHYRR